MTRERSYSFVDSLKAKSCGIDFKIYQITGQVETLLFQMQYSRSF